MEENKNNGLARFVGIVVAVTAALALQAWLAQSCVAFIWPSFSLPFWQWMVIVFTLRSLTSPLASDE